MRQLLFRNVFLGLLVITGASSAQAASLYIDPARSELGRGDAIELSVRLDVDEEAGECVNAIDAVISYTDNIVPVDVSIGDSIFSIWVEQPSIDKTNKTISFAGGMPNGYCGRVAGDPRLTNNLVKLIFRSPGFTIGSASDSPVAEVTFTDMTAAYLNDGFGTKVSPGTFGATMQLSKTAGPSIQDPWTNTVNQDTVPPEEFSIFLQKGNVEFAGEYYIVFNTTDKQTGINSYQVMEEPIEQFGSFSWGGTDVPWITARSPYVLKDQSLNSIIRVKAIDKAGNEYIATLLPEESIRTIPRSQMVTYAVFGFIGLIILCCLGVIYMFIRQVMRRRKDFAHESGTEEAEITDEDSYEESEELEEHYDQK